MCLVAPRYRMSQQEEVRERKAEGGMNQTVGGEKIERERHECIFFTTCSLQKTPPSQAVV